MIVTAILITDFYLRLNESKENKRTFILKHLYEIPALFTDFLYFLKITLILIYLLDY